MANYIETAIRYMKTQEDGTEATVTERYLIDAMTFTEAEARAIEQVGKNISGEYNVSAVKKTNYAEVFRCDESQTTWYKCKLAFITVDEITAKERKSNSYILVEAVDFKSALARLTEGMRGTMADYTIVSIAETTIVEVY